jgi:hypothetical protein
VIKRIRFATSNPELSREVFEERWVAACAAAAEAPAGARPRRVTVCTSRPDVLADPVHDGIAIEWFDDATHVRRFEAWLPSVGTRREEVVAIAASPVMVADELVLRGADWLDARWRDGGRTLKHMAIAKRAAGLSPAEFSERWKSRPGKVAIAGGPVVAIPDRARGCAYVQNHPRAGAAYDPYDAFNEVYFDDLDDLRFRIEWFADNLSNGSDSDLVSEAWFVAATEDVVWSD